MGIFITFCIFLGLVWGPAVGITVFASVFLFAALTDH